jgi:DNA-binding transcriptional MerR regulator
MATAQSVKAPKRAPKKTRDPLFADEKYTGSEPVWDTERALKMSQDEFDHFLRKSFSYYNYYYAQKDLKKHMVKWMQENGYNKKDVSAFIRSPDRSVPMTAYGLLMANRQGMPFREKELDYVKARIAVAITEAEPETIEVVAETTQIVRAPTIQDRLNEKTSEHLAYFEGIYDEIVVGATIDPKAYDYFVTNSVPQSQLGKFENYVDTHRMYLTAAMDKMDEQFVESYRHYRAADFKRHLAFFDLIQTSIDQYRQVKKATKKARVKRAPNKEKLVSKLKYMKEEKTLKRVSINPVDIIGAQEVWCYNTKTRKLYKYVADSVLGPLGIKGTSLTGFNTTTSVGKTLRKPEEKLKEFAKASKVQLRKFLDDIRSTETAGNGRINPDTILLRIN